MRNIQIQTKHNGVVSISVPEDKSEITLGSYIKLAELDIELHAVKEESAMINIYKEAGMDDNGEEYDYVCYKNDTIENIIKEGDILRSKLSLIIPEHDISKLDLIPTYQYGLIYDEAILELPAKPIVKFIHKDATKIDIDRIDNYINNELHPELDAKEIFDLKRRRKALETGEFILIEARDAVLKARSRTDNLQKSLPKLEEDIFDTLKNSSYNLEEYLKSLMEEDLTTLEEVRNNYKRISSIQKYIKEYNKGVYEAAPYIISHCCVPVGEEYVYVYAEERAKYFMSLDMQTVECIISFFLTLSGALIQDSPISLNLKKVEEVLSNH